MSASFADKQFHNGVGVGIIAGRVSRNLKIIDIDDASLFAPFVGECQAIAPGLITRLTLNKTPNGYHFGYRYSEIEGNQKLAQGVVDDKVKTLIETRGEGGYVLAPGCSPGCHPSGRLYEHIDGPPITEVPTITAQERQLLFQVARSFNEVVDEPEFTSDALSNGGSEGESFRTKPIAKFPCEDDLIDRHPFMSPPIINGLLRAGETANLISVSKAGKSWMAYNLALCVATGSRWLGRFSTERGRVLLIDNELHPQTLANRIPKVRTEMGFTKQDVVDRFEVWSLRGNLHSLDAIGSEIEKYGVGYFSLIIMDAKYRFIGEGKSENDNAAETAIYNKLDIIAEETGAAILLVHHSSKGDQSNKRVTDVGSGAGAQSRAADTHMLLREHDEDQVFVMDAAVRSFAPVESLALRWSFPLWHPAPDVNVGDLRSNKSGRKKNQEKDDKTGKENILKALQKGPMTANTLAPKAQMGKPRMLKLAYILEEEGFIWIRETEVANNKATLFGLVADAKKGGDNDAK